MCIFSQGCYKHCNEPTQVHCRSILKFNLQFFSLLLYDSVFSEAAETAVVALPAGLCGGCHRDHVRNGLQRARQMGCCHATADYQVSLIETLVHAAVAV